MTFNIPGREHAYNSNRDSFEERQEYDNSLSYVTGKSSLNRDNLSLFVKTLNGKTLVLNNLCSMMTINHLKRLIDEKDSSGLFSSDSYYPHLYFVKNKQRQCLHRNHDDSFLSALGLQRDDTIHVTAGLLGGMPPKKAAAAKKADKSGADVDEDESEGDKMTAPSKRSTRAGKADKPAMNIEENEEPATLKKGVQQAEADGCSDDEGETTGSEEGTSSEEFKEDDDEENGQLSPNPEKSSRTTNRTDVTNAEKVPVGGATRNAANNGHNGDNTSVENASSVVAARRVATTAEYGGNPMSRSVAPSSSRGNNAIGKSIVKDIPKENTKEKKIKKLQDGLDKKGVIEQIRANKNHVNYLFLLGLIDAHDRQKSNPAKNAVFNVMRQIYLLEDKVRSMNDLESVTGMGEKTRPLVEQALYPTPEKGQGNVVNDGEEAKKRTLKPPAGSVRVMHE